MPRSAPSPSPPPLLERLDQRLSPLGASQVKMFGGVAFMLNGHMAVGASKRGLLVRVGREGDATAARQPSASPMVMRGKPMAGYWRVEESALADAIVLDYWLDLALAHNRTLPPKKIGRSK